MVNGMADRRVAEDDEVTFTTLVAGVEPRLRRAFVAAYGPDAGRETLADVLGCTVSTLRNHLARGLEHARRELEDNSQ